MQIIWHGQSCFQIIANTQGKNGQVSLAIDPFDEKLGIKPPSFQADILAITHDHSDHNNAKAIKGEPFLIDGPGEYDVKGSFIQGIPAFHDKALGKERGNTTIYSINIEDIRICHLGDLGQQELTEDQLDKIDTVDILMIPVGGVHTIDAKEAVRIISQIEPKIVIPMHYHLPKLNSKIEGLENFLKAMGQKPIEPLGKLTIKKKDLPEDEEEMKIIVMQA